MNVSRICSIPDKKSFFLFGPRQTGKSTLVRSLANAKTWSVDLLQSEVYQSFSKNPALFRLQAIAKIEAQQIDTIVLDEIQRVPELLNEVHHLLELHPSIRCIMLGSSARKLRRGGVNLLAGRAVERYLSPFVYREVATDFDLESVLRFGSLPPIWGRPIAERIDLLQTYVHTYLEEEIRAEGLARAIGPFARFLDVAAASAGEVINLSNVSRECAVPLKTVSNYYAILEDTLVGFRLAPWTRSVRRRMAAHPKFFLFDLGVVNAINKHLTAGLDPRSFGRLFEQFIIVETERMRSLRISEASLYYWRTAAGAEVDLIIGKHGKLTGAFEIKSLVNVSGADLRGLRAFRAAEPDVPCMLICQAPEPFTLDGITVMPWKTYLQRLADWL
jgi:uncharacterized protein